MKGTGRAKRQLRVHVEESSVTGYRSAGEKRGPLQQYAEDDSSVTRAMLDPSGPFMRHPLQPHQLRDSVTRTEDTIVLCHLGVPRIDAGD
jgi:hypothetical protein